jgi:hypothetical protein
LHDPRSAKQQVTEPFGFPHVERVAHRLMAGLQLVGRPSATASAAARATHLRYSPRLGFSSQPQRLAIRSQANVAAIASSQRESEMSTLWRQPVVGSHHSMVFGSLSLQLRAVPGVHVPPWHVSGPLQRLRSLHDVPFVTGACWQVPPSLLSSVQTLESSQPGSGVCWQPVNGSQESMVAGSPSSQSRAVPAVQVPP